MAFTDWWRLGPLAIRISKRELKDWVGLRSVGWNRELNLKERIESTPHSSSPPIIHSQNLKERIESALIVSENHPAIHESQRENWKFIDNGITPNWNSVENLKERIERLHFPRRIQRTSIWESQRENWKFLAVIAVTVMNRLLRISKRELKD